MTGKDNGAGFGFFLSCALYPVTCNRLKQFLIGGIVSSIAMLLFIAGMQHAVPTRPSGPRWRVKSSIGTHHMLVVDVDAHPSASLKEIGESIVTPVIGQYDEVLIYVRSGKSTLRRIQWTPQHGYLELLISS